MAKRRLDFSALRGTLAQTGKKVDNALYQTVDILIDKLVQYQGIINEEQDAIRRDIDNLSPPSGSGGGGGSGGGASTTASYITKDNETAGLPNSIQLLAGTGISFDDTVPNIRTINATGGSSESGYWAPMTDGDPVETDLIFADGECVMIFVPTP